MINSKNDYFTKLSSKIALESRGSKQYWNIIKSLLNYDSTDSRSIPLLQVDGDLICDNKEKAKIFNDFFCNQSDLDDTNILTPNIFLRQQGSLGHIVITENEVEDILIFLDISKASGPDAVRPRLLKEPTQILKYTLCRLFNLSLRTEIFLTNWKCASVTPIFKKDSPSNNKNYKPISLISEKVIRLFINLLILQMILVRHWMRVRKLGSYFAILGRHLIGHGIGGLGFH